MSKGSFLTRLNIGQRLGVGFSVLVALTVLVGLVSFATTYLQNQALGETVSSHEGADLALEMSAQLAAARRAEQNFLLRWKTEGYDAAYANYVVSNQEHISTFLELLAESRQLENDEAALAQLAEIEQAANEYQELFQVVVGRLAERGHLDTGLEGAFRDAAHELEDSPVIASNPELQATLLQMRRNEKDFLLRGLQFDVDETGRFTLRLQNQLRALNLPAAEQEQLLELSNVYLTNFFRLAGLERQVALDVDEMHAIAESITPVLDTIHENQEVKAEEQLASLRAVQQLAGSVNTVLLVVSAVIGVALALVIRRSIVRPLGELTDAATRMAQGEFDRRIETSRRDETAALARAFNTMADQIQEMVAGLEARVAERTADLAITLEVGALATSIRSMDELLPRIVEFIRARFGLYYTQIYLLDEARRYAYLRAGTGGVGQQLVSRGHRLDLSETSLVATAVQNGSPVLVSDTETSSVHKKNPLLPDTRSEVTIPLVVGGDILGVLDMQSAHSGAFNEENLYVFQAMANQLAAVMQGARAYDDAQAAIALAEVVNQRLTGETWQPYLEKLADGRAVGYQYDLESPKPLEQEIASQANAVVQRILLRGQPIGAIQVQEDHEREWSPEEMRLVRDVSTRVAQALEQFRAFDETKKSEQELRRAQAFLNSVIENIPHMIFVKDARDLRFVSLNKAGEELLGLTRDDYVGKNDYDFFPKEEADFFTAKDREVLEGRVTVDIPEEAVQTRYKGTRYLHTIKVPILAPDGTPQYLLGIATDITVQKQQQEAARQRALEIELVASVSAAAASTLELEGLLQGVSDLTKESFNLYHAHIYILDDVRENLVLSAGAGEPGRMMMERGHHIPLSREHSLVARAARTRQGVIANDVTQEPDFLPNPLLPETRSELSVPMVAGDTLIGVLDVQSDVVNRFTDNDVRVYSTLADQIAIAAQNARAYQEAEARREMAELLAGANAVLSQATDEAQILAVGAIMAERFSVVNSNLLYFETDDGNQIVSMEMVAVRSGYGNEIPLDTLPTTRYTVAEFPLVQLLYQRPDDAVFVEDVETDPRCDEQARAISAASGTRAFILVPLRTYQEWQGMYIFTWAEPQVFTEQAREFFTAIMPNAASVVANRRAFLSLQKAEAQIRENEAQLAEAQRIARLGRWSWDLATSTIVWNEQMFEINGLDPNTPMNFDVFSSTLHPEDAPGVMKGIQDAMQSTGAHVFTEYRIIRPDGEIRYLTATGTVKRDAQGNPVEMIGIVQDITERRESEAAVAAERNLMRTLIDNLPDYIYVRDRENRFLIANQTLARTIGVETPDALVGKTDFDLFPHDLAAGYHADDMKVMETGQPLRNREEKVVDSKGNEQWILTNKIPLRNLQGEIIGLVGNGRDITDRRQTEHERQVLFNAANKLNNARTGDELLEAVLDYARQQNTIGGTLLYVDTDRKGEPEWAEILASWNADGNTAVPVGTRFYLPEFPFANLWTANPLSPTFVGDIETSEAVDDVTRGLLAQTGARAMVLLPLYAQERWIGLITFTWAEPQAFTEQEQTIYTSLTRQATAKADALRAAEATERAREQAEILYRISRNLTNARTMEELLEATARYARDKDVYSATLMIIDSDQEDHPSWAEIVATWATPGGTAAPVGTRFYLPEFPFAKLWTANPGEPTLLGDAINAEGMDEGTRALFRQFNIAGIALLPLHTRDRWVGLLSYSWDKPTTFTEQDERIFRSISRQATSVLDAMRSTALTQKRALELATVAQVSAAATTILDVEQLLQTVSDLTKGSFNLYHAHIYLMDESGERLLLVAGSGEAGRIMKEQARSISIRHVNSIVARAARERTSVIVNDVTQEASFMPNPLLPETKSEMAVPMIVGDELIGVLDVQANVTNRFTETDAQIKTTLAAQVAVAVRNARAFERERETAERLREVDRLKSQFLANMSHELRTPLNSIIGYSEVLLDGGDGELSGDAVEDIQTIHGSGQHLLSIINDILDLAKIEAGQMQINPQASDLPKFLGEIVHAMQVMVKDKPVTLELVQDTDMPPVYADPVRLRQIVWNLVSNAVKFTEQGAVTVSVGTLDENTAYVKVTDTGIGIRPEDVPVVFEQFRQVDGSSTRRAGGTGLGLTITRHLVRLHGGEIHVESEYGEGSTFWFTLPVYVPENS